jgi:hypothetical protein
VDSVRQVINASSACPNVIVAIDDQVFNLMDLHFGTKKFSDKFLS